MNLKKIASLLMLVVLAFGLVACNDTAKKDEEVTTETETTETETTEEEETEEETETTEEEETEEETSDFDTSSPITVISREDGSGTRGAFTEITGVLVKENDEEVDKTTVEAMIQNGTNGVMTGVAGDPNAIGYISLGSLDDTVKAIKVDGGEATADTVKSSEYPVARPFNIAWKEDTIGDVGNDLKAFILSPEGQAIVEEEGYVAVDDIQDYTPAGVEGQITVAGSTSVTPVMEKIVEAYKAANPGVEVDIQSTGSSAGMTAAMDGTAHIGMASRELKDEESAELESIAMAMDGIAVIVNNENPLEELTMDQIRQIYVGEITTWSEVE